MEQINGQDLFGSGGHTWVWSDPQPVYKDLATAGTVGAASMVTHVPPATCTIVGRDGGPAILRASGVDRAAAESALGAIERLILTYRALGGAYAWQDDHGNSGVAIQIRDYRRVGSRIIGDGSDGQVAVWQHYTCRLVELTGGPFITPEVLA